MSSKYNLPKDARLLKPSEYQRVFAQPNREWARHFMVFARPRKEKSRARLGITVAKKRVKLASERNRVKRWIRESFRLNQEMLLNWDIVVVVLRGADGLKIDEQAAFYKKWLQIQWTRLEQLLKSC